MRLQMMAEVSPRKILPMAALFFLYYSLQITEPRKDNPFSGCYVASISFDPSAVNTDVEANGYTQPQPTAIHGKTLPSSGTLLAAPQRCWRSVGHGVIIIAVSVAGRSAIGCRGRSERRA